MNPRSRRSNRAGPGGRDRAVAPAIGKTLEIGIGVLVVALLASTLYGSVVPGYRTTAGTELADRTLARAVATTESAVPPGRAYASTTRRIDLPATIRGSTYEIHADGHALELRHPQPEIGGRVPLAVPRRVVSVSGAWRSTDGFEVEATASAGNVSIEIGGRP